MKIKYEYISLKYIWYYNKYVDIQSQRQYFETNILVLGSTNFVFAL